MTLIVLTLAWLAGILLAAWLALPAAVWLWLLVLPLCFLIIWRGHPAAQRVQWLFLFLLLGALRYEWALPSPDTQSVAQFNDQGRYAIIGVVAEEPKPSDHYAQLKVEVRRIELPIGWEDASGRVLVQAPREADVRYGDEIRAEGELTTPEDGADFSYRDYLARESIGSLLHADRFIVMMRGLGNPFIEQLYNFKSAGLASLRSLFPEPASALLSGILLGRDENLPPDLQSAFTSTNTRHIIAISGFNIAVLALYFGKAYRRLLPIRVADWIIILTLIVYTLLVGASASVVRAAIMGIALIIAGHFGRGAWPLNSLAGAALIMTAHNPFALWDLGFQLSFLATLGLVCFLPRWEEWIAERLAAEASASRRQSVIGFLQEGLLVTLAAWLMTTPLLLIAFGRFSLIGLLTNALILPVQPAVMLLGGAAMLVQMLASSLATLPILPILVGACAQALAAAAYVPTQYTILIVQWTAAIPGPAFELSRGWELIIASLYIPIFLFAFLPVRRALAFLPSRPALAYAGLAVAVVLFWSLLLALPDPRTHIQFLGTSNGEAVWIQTSHGGRILIDGSDEPNELLGHLAGQTTFWNRRIDLLVATHLEESNLASLDGVLERYGVGAVIEPPSPAAKGSPAYEEWRRLLGEKGVPLATAREGLRMQIDEVEIEVIAPADDVAGANVALRVNASNRRFVLAHALKANDLDALAAGYADVSGEWATLPLKFDPFLLRRIGPATGILFAGRALRQQPASETLSLLEGTNTLRTDERGDIEVILDGERMEVRTER